LFGIHQFLQVICYLSSLSIRTSQASSDSLILM
jgi:hypothetical protein